MRSAATILILALSWTVQIIVAEGVFGRFDADDAASETADYVEEKETETAERVRKWPFTFRDVEESTERDTYQDVCTGYIEGGGNVVHTTTCPYRSTCCFGGGFVTCTFSPARCRYSSDETAPPSSEKTEESKSSALSTGGIIGIAVSAGCSVIGLIFTVAFKIWKHRRKEKESMQNDQGHN